ncbi:something about silencing protein 10 isoform X2 [Nilaparvata lugens]|uniref:something about silencing protein 10 isoform X2 n=1 Tax=Nilaparvata lugens TaxID=108931 RepID=UPI00193E78C9|nr:something about silencing protein 10 isoform X2 [Nilaparvata lugens]
MKKNRMKKNPDHDLDRDTNDYEPTDSDDDYDDNEKILLDKAKKGKSFAAESEDDDDYDTDNEEGVLDVYTSSDEDEGDAKQNEQGIEDSDIEGMEDDDDLPDTKAWGKRKNNYYHNDYAVDDSVGFSKEAEEEQALMEEKEARTLQMKLASQMENVDLLGAITKSVVSKSKEEASSDESDEEAFKMEDEMIKQDLSKLTKREKLALLQKQSPEFLGLVGDFKERLKFVIDVLMPVSKLIDSGHIARDSPASRYVSTKTAVSLNYCINLIFYLLLKRKGVDIKGHPVTERILAFRKTLEQLDNLESQELLDQLKQIVAVHQNVDDLNSCTCEFGSNELVKQKKRLKLLSKTEKPETSNKRPPPEDNETNKKKVRFVGEDEESPFTKNLKLKQKKKKREEEQEEEDGEEESGEENAIDADDLEEGKRAITYEMAKNKGLTPKRKKELRNPRVKHRNKYSSKVEGWSCATAEAVEIVSMRGR